MVRAPCFDKNGIKRGAWSQDEDNKLRAYIEKFGHTNWRELPKLAGLSRCGKSCRLRWMNYLHPNVKLGNFTKEEEDVIIRLHNKFGNKWSKMATLLPGRSDNEIKNHWHTHLKNRIQDKQNVLQSDQSVAVESCYTNPKECLLKYLNSTAQQEVEVLVEVLSSSSTSESSPSSTDTVSDSTVPSDITPQISHAEGNIWNDCSLLDDDGFISSSDYKMLFSTLGLTYDFISQTCEDYVMEDMVLWST